MTPNRVVIAAFLILFITWLAYWYNFGHLLSFQISKSQEHWGLLGDFLGGVLNPILTFLTIVILIKSLSLQKTELDKTKHYEKLKSFESHFFNMIASQKTLFNSFQIIFNVQNVAIIKTSASAVITLEDIIITLKDNGKEFVDIQNIVNQYDAEDSIYSVTRTFCVIAKLVKNMLSEENGFTKKDRKDYYEILLNYTDFSLVRLIMIAIKYTDNPQVQSLRGNIEFIDVLKDMDVKSYLDDI